MTECIQMINQIIPEIMTYIAFGDVQINFHDPNEYFIGCDFSRDSAQRQCPGPRNMHSTKTQICNQL